MDTNMIALIVSTVALLVALATFFLWNNDRKKPRQEDPSFNARPLQLQAYERLTLLAERIALPNLISRANGSGGSARDMQMLLLESIKQEYDYNATQQIYVSPVAWKAIVNLKEQNMLIINQVASSMPPEASGLDLNRRILEFAMSQPKGDLHSIVLEALNYEAKKLMR